MIAYLKGEVCSNLILNVNFKNIARKRRIIVIDRERVGSSLVISTILNLNYLNYTKFKLPQNLNYTKI
jgi:hypothetical protein